MLLFRVLMLVCSRRSTVCVFADAFADAETDDNNSKDYVHIRIQQRNGKKSLTTVQVISCTLPDFVSSIDWTLLAGF